MAGSFRNKKAGGCFYLSCLFLCEDRLYFSSESFLFSLSFSGRLCYNTQLPGQKKKPRAHCNNVLQVHGADSRIRTGDLILTKRPSAKNQAILLAVIKARNAQNTTSSFYEKRGLAGSKNPSRP